MKHISKANAELAARITYLITDGSGCYKVGCTRSPETLLSRIDNLRLGNSQPLTVAFLFVRPDSGLQGFYHTDAGYALEQAILAQFDWARSYPGSDWLCIDLDHIIAYVRQSDV